MAYKPAILAAVDGGTGQSSYTTGDLLYASSSTALSKLALGSAGQILSLSGGVPAWVTYSSVIDYIDAVLVATTASLNATYVNGVAGVGATLINAGALAAFSVDGQSPAINSRVLVKNQGSTFQNGVYTLTTVGSGAVAWILTRSTDYNTPSEINVGDVIPVQTGTANANTSWLQGATVTTIGTDPITFTQFQSAPISTTQYDVLVGGANNSVASVGPGTAGQVLQSAGNASNPAYSTSTYPTTNALNTLLYASSANTMAALATATNGVLITDGTTGIPSISSTLPTAVQGNITSVGNISSGTWSGTAIAQTKGGSGQTNFTGNKVLISSQTASASSAINFTTGITGYDNYYLEYYQVINATASQPLLLQFSTDGGSSYSNSGYTTSGYLAYSVNLISRVNISTAGCMLSDNVDNSATVPTDGYCTIYNLANTSYHKITNSFGNMNVGTAIAQFGMGSRWSTTTAVNAMRVLAASGNITSGSFKLYGIVN